MEIAVIPIDESHIPKVQGLIAGYLSSSNAVDESDPSPKQLEQCEQLLYRFTNDSSAYCYLAKQDQEYIGFIILSWSFSISKGYPVLRIEALYSSAKHRNKGIGRKLMEHYDRSPGDVEGQEHVPFEVAIIAAFLFYRYKILSQAKDKNLYRLPYWTRTCSYCRLGV